MNKITKSCSRLFNSLSVGKGTEFATTISKKFRKQQFGNKVPDTKISTMNDLPSPDGCWQQEYNRKQVTNNIVLFLSALFMTGTIWVAKDIMPFQFGVPYYPLSKEDFPLDE